MSKPISKPKPNPTVCYYPEEGGLALTATDLESLAPDQWITDQVVALELSRLEDDLGKSPGGVHTFDSTFYQKLHFPPQGPNEETEALMLTEAEKHHFRVSHLLKAVEIREKSLLLFPSCSGSHWFLFGAHLPSKQLFILDSLKSQASKSGALELRNALELENIERFGKKIVISTINLKVPQQGNGSDCGLYMLSFLKNILEKGTESFLKAAELKNVLEWIDIEGPAQKRKEVIDFILKKSKDQGLEDWKAKRSGREERGRKREENYDKEQSYKEKDKEHGELNKLEKKSGLDEQDDIEKDVESKRQSKDSEHNDEKLRKEESGKRKNVIDHLFRIKESLASQEDEDKLLTMIENLGNTKIDVEVLKATQLGKTMKNISKANKELASGKAAKKLVKKWRELVEQDVIRKDMSDEEDESELKSKSKEVKVKFKCTVCDREFKYLARFKTHSENKHNSRRPPKYLCESCPKRFFHTFSLERHTKKCHGEFNCDQCVFKTDQESKINSHKLTHIQREFKCSICEEVFVIREDLWKHKNNKHRGKRKVVDITCEVCKLKYKSKDSFRVHLKKHHPIKHDSEESDKEENMTIVYD